MVDEDQLYVGPKGQIRQWFDEGVIREADFMVIGRDGFDNSLHPVYHPSDGASTTATVTKLSSNGDKAMEIYDLHEAREPQVNAHRSWNNEQVRENQLMTSKSRDKKTLPGISSQAGVGTHVGGVAKYQPGAPPAGEPGSWNNPVPVSREKQAVRRSEGLPIQGAALGINRPDGALNAETGVAAASIKGFAKGFADGARAQGPPAPERTAPDAPDTSVPGASQPLIVDAVDAVPDNLPASAGEPGTKVVINPDHRARLEALDGQDSGDLQGGGDRYGR